MDSSTHTRNGGAADAPPESPRCPACGAIGYRHDRYCPCCGSLMAIVCERCGVASEHPVANYCTHCGWRLHDAMPVADDPSA